MKFLIVSELSINNSNRVMNGCEVYQADNAEIFIARDFVTAKKHFSIKISEAFNKRVKGLFNKKGQVIRIQNMLKYFEEESAALNEIEKILSLAKNSNLDEYKYKNNCKCNCDTGCSIVKYTPSCVEFTKDYENGFAYFHLNAHNMNIENKIYYFEYKEWYKYDTSFRVVMYPIAE